MIDIAIRPEQPGDEMIIHQLTEAAFKNMPFSEGEVAFAPAFRP